MVANVTFLELSGAARRSGLGKFCGVGQD